MVVVAPTPHTWILTSTEGPTQEFNSLKINKKTLKDL